MLSCYFREFLALSAILYLHFPILHSHVSPYCEKVCSLIFRCMVKSSSRERGVLTFAQFHYISSVFRPFLSRLDNEMGLNWGILFYHALPCNLEFK